MIPPGDEAAGAAAVDGRERPVAPVRWLDGLVGVVLAVAMLGVLVFTVGQVADRYLVKSAFDAHDQYARISLVWLTFIGIAVGIRDRANVRIELVSHLAPPRWRQSIALLLELVTVLVAGLIMVVGWRLLEIGAFQAIIGTSLNYDVMYLGLLSGMGLMVLFLVLRFITRLSRGRLRLDTLPQGHDDPAA